MVRLPTANRVTQVSVWVCGFKSRPRRQYAESFSVCLHIIYAQKTICSHHTNWLGGRPLKAEMPVRIRLGVPFGFVAQLAERLAVNQDVAGSNPAGAAIIVIFHRLVPLGCVPPTMLGPRWMRPLAQCGGWHGSACAILGSSVCRWRRIAIFGTVLAIGSRLVWKASAWGNPGCRFESCLFRQQYSPSVRRTNISPRVLATGCRGAAFHSEQCDNWRSARFESGCPARDCRFESCLLRHSCGCSYKSDRVR